MFAYTFFWLKLVYYFIIVNIFIDMNNQTIFKLIQNRFQNDEVSNFHGIILKPILTDNNLFSFEFSNPEKKSYNYNCLINHFYDEVYFIAKLIGVNLNNLMFKFSNPNEDGFNFNNSDAKTIDKLFKNINRFEFDNRSGIHIVSDMNVIEWELISRTDDDRIEIHVKGELSNIDNKVGTREFSLDSNLGFISNWYYDDYRNYDITCYNILEPAIRFITENPLLYSESYMILEPMIRPILYDEEGYEIEF